MESNLSLTFYQETLEHIPVPLIILSAQSQKIIYVTRSACEILHYGKGDLIGQSLDIILPERVRGKLHSYYMTQYLMNPVRRVMAPGKNNLTFVNREGIEVPVLIDLRPYSVDGMGLMVAATMAPLKTTINMNPPPEEILTKK